MKVLVVGSGGREHALVWKLAQSPLQPQLYCAPGNAGIAAHATCIDLAAGDIDGIVAFARSEQLDLVVVGPELPLLAGLADALELAGVAVFGPRAAAARIEGSKSWAKQVMHAAGVPTAASATFCDLEQARSYVRGVGAPVVVKADGVAAGKGVVVAQTLEQADDALVSMLRGRTFGDAGATVVVEQFLRGREVSMMALVDGRTVVPLAAARDHKRAFDGDQGPNTGGMGAFSPVVGFDDADVRRVRECILQPVADALAFAGTPFRGVLYAGLMLTDDGPQVIEFNARFGDPETQAVLPRMRGDLLPLLHAVATGRLHEMREPRWTSDAAVCVVLAAAGYPGTVRVGDAICGLGQAEREGVALFHAGTAWNERGELVTSGGRVLSVVARGDDLNAARTAAYEASAGVQFDGAHMRRDIADVPTPRFVRARALSR